ncbi:MAG TPA: hypothetical protein VMQ11_13270 [Alphaproteobacteria bacterium]|nr:hypothetical protein [Alphaproteobacteria bacterium]
MKPTKHAPLARRASAVVVPFPKRPQHPDSQARLARAVARMEIALAEQLKEARGFQDAAARLKIVMRDLGAALRTYKYRLHIAQSELSVTMTRSRYLADLMDGWGATNTGPA